MLVILKASVPASFVDGSWGAHSHPADGLGVAFIQHSADTILLQPGFLVQNLCGVIGIPFFLWNFMTFSGCVVRFSLSVELLII